MGLCHKIDDFIAEKVHWIATLSDGQVVYQDDYRPGEAEPVAWKRLATYIDDKHKDGKAFGIERLQIKFWDHIEDAAPPSLVAYYFINGIMALQGVPRTYNYYAIGHVDPNKNDDMIVIKWLIPEITPLEIEVRPIPYGDPLLISRTSRF